jgi:hypothetical protein
MAKRRPQMDAGGTTTADDMLIRRFVNDLPFVRHGAS